MKYGITAKDAMTRHPVKINPDVNVMNAARKMIKENVGSLLVIEKNKLLGILTEKDIIQKVIAKGKDFRKIKVKDIMTTNVISISSNTDLYDIAKLMNEKGVRRLPVIDNGVLKGIVTEKDLLKIEPSLIDVLIEKIKIREPDIKRLVSGKMRHPGTCEICGNYTDELIESRGMFICNDCKSSLD
ncbi:MAG: CBS domain-containing protein [Candidatus Parvarchaeota archaeon]|nr:CBS domain-containing protein [Candidatus Jingweiarchaeum tengchongense]MCW1298407.1 CBS domain-containing protein [Candidatus Jingweiarchaeum tengchongense]MCW1300291.1 CBS domain-containing protein [Candidatus Jingweiarchaeum tengchongense]MCW1304913.1 CBS domain-containing protein [Candidatus Jingweiarchaeum tengchongense]MCW1306145.1 CBS domain-containing protein [Candidatus Jingweiarchaeum tengchongense]